MSAKHTQAVSFALFATALVWYSWFLTPVNGTDIPGGAALASSVVLDHRVHINRYWRNTGERTEQGENHYTDRAPGAAWLAMPALTAWSFKLVVDPGDPWQLRVMSVTATALPAALLTVLIFLFTMESAGAGAALAAALAHAFATPAFEASTGLNAAQPAAAMLFCAFLMSDRARRGAAVLPFSAFIEGFLLGAACVTLAAVSPAAAAISVFCLRARRGRVFRFAALHLAGAAIPVFCVFAYNFAAVGRWTLFVPGAMRPAQAFSAFNAALPLILLLAASPFLALAVPGLLAMLKKPEMRGRAAAMLFACLAILVSSAVASMLRRTEAGSAALLAALPFAAVGLASYLDRLPAAWRGLIYLVIAICGASAIVSAVFSPFAGLRPTIMDGLAAAPALAYAPPAAVSGAAAVLFGFLLTRNRALDN
jgi:heme/copper-type cytochrome/quinol oxidase subunit 4